MDAETKQLLMESIELAKQNNEMLNKLVRAQKMAMVYRFVYWGIIILSTFGALYFIKPFISNIFNVYTGGLSGTPKVNDVINNLSNRQQMQDFFDSLK